MGLVEACPQVFVVHRPFVFWTCFRNKISGTLPNCLHNITAVCTDVNDNIILGLVQVVWKGIEIEFGANLKHLGSIDISSNYLSLLRLLCLKLPRNNLIGGIPRNFGKLSSLEFLDLSRNPFSGRIPTSFSSLNFWSYLDLSCNNFTGRIPLSTQMQSFNASPIIGNIQLCGPPLKKDCPGDEIDNDSGVDDGSENTGTMEICSMVLLNPEK